MWLAETTGSLQLAEPLDDEFLSVEIHGITWTNLPHPNAAKQDDGRLITAEEVEPPSVWPATLNPIEKGTMTGFQQALPEVLAMTVSNEALTRQRNRP